MATFDQNITAIRQAQYGYEVRDAIAEGLTQCHNSLDYTESDTTNYGKKIEISFPDGKRVIIYTSVNKPDGYYASVQLDTNIDFAVYRKTVFESISLLDEITK